MLLIWGDKELGDHVRQRVVDALIPEMQRRSRSDEIVKAPDLDASGVTKADVPVLITLPWDASGDKRKETAAAATGVLWIGASPQGDVRARLGLQKAPHVKVWALLVTYADHPPDGLKEAADADAVWVMTPELDLHRRTVTRVVRAVTPAAVGGLRIEVGDSDGVTTRAAARSATAWLDRLTDAEDVEEYTIMGGSAMMVQYSDGSYERFPSPVATDDELISEMKFLASHAEGQRDRDHRFDFTKPQMDCLVAGRWRAHGEAWVTHPPFLTLRSNRGGDITLDKLDVADNDLLGLLSEVIAGTYRHNVVIAAAMGAGKTTLMQAILAKVPDHERIDTIEDTAELQLQHYGLHDYTFERLVRDENADGQGKMSMSAHIRNAKRADTKKLVVGEVRGEGTLALLDAMTSGITGCLVSLHSKAGQEVLGKLLSYAISEGATLEFARGEIDSAVDLVVWMSRDAQKRRRIFDVSQLLGIDGATGGFVTRTLWKLDVGHAHAVPVGQPTGTLRTAYVAAGLRHLLEDEAPVGANGQSAQYT